MADLISERYAFFDVEASGLARGSFPIDVAWCLYGRPFSALIAPHHGWPMETWDEVAQSIHGYALPYLRKYGKTPKQVARSLNEALRGMTAYTDNLSRDVGWTDMIFEAGESRRQFEIASVGPLLGSLGVKSADAYNAFELAREKQSPDGKASAGVTFLKSVFDTLQDKGILTP